MGREDRVESQNPFNRSNLFRLGERKKNSGVVMVIRRASRFGSGGLTAWIFWMIRYMSEYGDLLCVIG